MSLTNTLSCSFLALTALLWPFAQSISSQESSPLALFTENPIAIYGKEVRYDVFRNGKNIGNHVLEFDVSDSTLLVSSLSSLVVRYMGIPVYKYTYRAKEIWEDGSLRTVESEIRDNRKDLRVIKATLQERVTQVTDRGKSQLAPLVQYATTHWHPGALKVGRMFHTTHGRVRNVKINSLGSERIALRDTRPDATSKVRDVVTTAYDLTGGFAAKLWYDEYNRWVRLQFNADDGSRIDYKCTSCNPL